MMSLSALLTWLLLLLGFGTPPCDGITPVNGPQTQCVVNAASSNAGQTGAPMHFSNDISNGI